VHQSRQDKEMLISSSVRLLLPCITVHASADALHDSLLLAPFSPIM
jgi:hypothetical protein